MTAEERIFSIVRGGLYAKLPSLALPLGRLTCRVCPGASAAGIPCGKRPAGAADAASAAAPHARPPVGAAGESADALGYGLRSGGRPRPPRAFAAGAGDACGLFRPLQAAGEAGRKLPDPLPPKPVIGSGSGNAAFAVRPDARGSRAFAALLRECSEMRENRHVSGDEFQYAWYLYGLEHYGGMPLIEPLEYSEERRLRELAVVIDTSASCSRSLCAAFLGELAGILTREDLFFERFNLHILECDCEVQQDTRLTTLAELTDWLRTMTLHGGGGTDFRPAFRYVDGLVERGEFAHLPGLLYFTDGYGVFPDMPPAYRAVFVMLRYRYDDIDLPAWAEKLILEAEAPKGDEQWI